MATFIHLVPRVVLDSEITYPLSLCNVTVERAFATSKVNDATCPQCTAECGCSSAPTMCDACASVDHD